MKMVTLTVDMRPWRMGDRIPLPNEVAATLLADGDAKDPEDFEGLSNQGSTSAEVTAVAAARAGYRTGRHAPGKTSNLQKRA